MSFSPAQAFSTVIVYLRFSSDGQADGYSFERQRRAAQERLSRWKLPEGTPVEWLEDAGYSAYTGKHTRSGQLGKFVQRVQSGELKNGLFICERVSRASRQGSLALLSMLNVLLQNGFTIQFLEETESFDTSQVARPLSACWGRGFAPAARPERGRSYPRLGRGFACGSPAARRPSRLGAACWAAAGRLAPRPAARLPTRLRPGLMRR